MLLSFLQNLTESRTLGMNTLMRIGCLCEYTLLNQASISLLLPMIGISIPPYSYFPSFLSLQSLPAFSPVPPYSSLFIYIGGQVSHGYQ